MNVTQTGATHTRGHTGETLFIDVKSIQTTRRTHQRAKCQRLTTGTGTEVTDHFATTRLDQTSDHLATFVLNVDLAVLIERPTRQTGLGRQADTVGRHRRSESFDTVLGQFGQHFFALSLQEIHTEVKRSAFLHGFKKGFVIGKLLLQAVIEPIRQFATNVFAGVFGLRAQDVVQRTGIVTDQTIIDGFATILASQRDHGRQARSANGLNRLHLPRNRGKMAQRVEDCFGDQTTIARTELVVQTEETAHQHVSRTVHLQNRRKGLTQFVDDQLRNTRTARADLTLRNVTVSTSLRATLFLRHGTSFLQLTGTSGTLALGHFFLSRATRARTASGESFFCHSSVLLNGPKGSKKGPFHHPSRHVRLHIGFCLPHKPSRHGQRADAQNPKHDRLRYVRHHSATQGLPLDR